jgi:hypothetical protein
MADTLSDTIYEKFRLIHMKLLQAIEDDYGAL